MAISLLISMAELEPVITGIAKITVIPLETNIPRPTPAMIKKNMRVAVMIICVATIWVIGVILHDPWLRPWGPVLLTCGLLTVVSLCIYMLVKFRYRVAAGLLLLVSLFVTVPLEILVRFAIVQNQTKASVEARFLSVDNKRQKKATIAPGESWKFVYFAGGKGGRAAIPIILEMRNLSSGVLVRTQIDLPIPKKGPILRISDEWFVDKQLSH